MKKILIAFLLLPISLFAQNPVGQNSWFCCENHNPCIHFTSEADLIYHNCKEHGIGCPVGSAGNNGSGKIFNSSPIQAGISGSLIFGLVGYAIHDPNGKNQALTGATTGYGIFSGLGLLASKKERTVGGKIINGILTGGSLGYGSAQIEKSYAKGEKKDHTALYTGIGAATVAIGNVAFSKKTKGGYDAITRKKKFFSNTAFNLSGNKFGIIVRL